MSRILSLPIKARRRRRKRGRDWSQTSFKRERERDSQHTYYLTQLNYNKSSNSRWCDVVWEWVACLLAGSLGSARGASSMGQQQQQQQRQQHPKLFPPRERPRFLVWAPCLSCVAGVALVSKCVVVCECVAWLALFWKCHCKYHFPFSPIYPPLISSSFSSSCFGNTPWGT